MSYTPDDLEVDNWTSPISIVGQDMITGLDEAVNQIVDTDPSSIKEHLNSQMAKIPPYLTSELNKIFSESEKKTWEAEAWEKTCNSYANEAEDAYVKVYTSNGDGTFSSTNTTDHSAYHYSKKSEEAVKNYRGKYTSLAAANSSVANPLTGDFVLIDDGRYSIYPSYYDSTRGGFIKNVPSTYGGNIFYGGQALQRSMLLDGGMNPDTSVTPDFNEANDFLLQDIARDITIENPVNMPAYDTYIQKGIFFVESNGYNITWGDQYDFADAYTLDSSKVNRFSYHTFNGRVKITYAGAI